MATFTSGSMSDWEWLLEWGVKKEHNAMCAVVRKEIHDLLVMSFMGTDIAVNREGVLLPST